MKTPFRYYGNKAVIAEEIWRRLGDPAYYEPFAGSLSVLLARPRPGRYEFVGDTDCVMEIRNETRGDGEESDRPFLDPPSVRLIR